MDEIGRMAHQRVKYGEKAAGRLDRTNANTARYAEAARTVAADANVPFVDLFAITRDAMAELEDASFGGMGDDGDSDDDGGSFSASVASPAAALAFPAHRSIFEDGIHFDARGQHAVFDAVMRTVGAFDDLRTALDPERLRPDWPWGPEMREGAASAWREKFAAHEDAARREERARRRELEWKGGVGLGRLPGGIARQRGHPQAEAINVCGWWGVLTLGLLLPLAYIWAYTNPVGGSPGRTGTS